MKNRVCLLLTVVFLFLLVSCSAEPEMQNGKKDYVFRAGDTEIAVGADGGEVVKALGTPISYSEDGKCDGTGDKFKNYGYSGFSVKTDPQNGVDRVYQIRLTSDRYATAEGITIGNSREDVLEKYGTPDFTGKTSVAYYAKTMQLEFHFSDDGKVTNILYNQLSAG